MAASISTSTAPATGLSFYLIQQPPSFEVKNTSLLTYNWILHHLTACLHYAFEPSSTSLSGRAPSDWHDLWSQVQSWYDSRPVEMQSLVDIGSIERSQIDPLNTASFPIHLYSSAIAVQAAIFYHITALLLVQHKPRLLNIPGRRQHFTSPNWHARAIAGIVTSNEFSEQWDPIVIASLLYIARDITYSAQQNYILDSFETISAVTGISLEDETKQLRSLWATASLVEDYVAR